MNQVRGDGQKVQQTARGDKPKRTWVQLLTSIMTGVTDSPEPRPMHKIHSHGFEHRLAKRRKLAKMAHESRRINFAKLRGN